MTLVASTFPKMEDFFFYTFSKGKKSSSFYLSHDLIILKRGFVHSTFYPNFDQKKKLFSENHP